MKRLCVLLALALPAFSQARNAFLGRWDLTLTSPRAAWPQWMEIVEKDGKLDGRIQPRGGAVRPIVAMEPAGNARLLVTVQAATDRAAKLTWELTVLGDTLAGKQTQGDNTDTAIVGVRAPELKRPMPKAWTDPEPLFNGKDLTGWQPVNNPGNSHWVVKDGTLFNEAR